MVISVAYLGAVYYRLCLLRENHRYVYILSMENHYTIAQG